MKRTRGEAVRAIVQKRSAPAPTVTTTGSDAVSDRAANAIERLIEIGREVDARQRRERGSAP